MQRSSSQLGKESHHHPWMAIKLDRSNISLMESECGSTSTIMTNSNYGRHADVKLWSSLRRSESEAQAAVPVHVSSDAGGISSFLLRFTLLLFQFLASPPIYFCFWGRVSSLAWNPLARRSVRWWICFFWTHGEVVGALAGEWSRIFRVSK
ncbi:hypothetical protein F2Q69_00055122 [Brassica cretica]|uniref:Uncharacterized protein n=1 Tax=Brassica cretica TaxID=69181 RepID=A0A8S9N8H5_BRACR|nr:hypothetical protein F2Q69_00055122 [Brassica cretica]